MLWKDAHSVALKIFNSAKKKLFVCEDCDKTFSEKQLSNDVSLDDESSRFQWVPLDEVIRLPLADSQRRRINDVMEYSNLGTRKMI